MGDREMDLTAKVRKTVQKYEMLSPSDSVLVAVSGGPDSVALLLLLSRIQEMELRLEVAHLQHGIRGEESCSDALFVKTMADRLGLPFHLKEMSLPGIKSARGKGNLEAMAREERYRFLLRIAENRGIGKIATGHTRDDQVETFFMWLLRGSGRGGLGGMPPVRRLDIPGVGGLSSPLLIRPLIEISRQEILEHLVALGQEYRTDRSNLHPALLRNWIRLRLLPQLREKIDPRLDERVARLTDLLREEEIVLERMARERLGGMTDGKELRRRCILQEDQSMRRRMVRQWLKMNLGDLRGICFRHVEAALRFIIQGPPQGYLSFPRNRNLVKTYETVRLEKRGPKVKPVSYSYTFVPGEGLDIPEAGVTIQSSRTAFTPGMWPQDDLEACFDLAALPETLTVRNFRAGDRFRPLGMQGHKKIKDLFIDKKVASVVRSSHPLVLARDEILWIPGYARSEVAKVNPDTSEVLRAKLVVRA